MKSIQPMTKRLRAQFILKVVFYVLLVFGSVVYVTAQEVLPEVVGGRVERLPLFASEYVAPRNVDVWLPEGYSDLKEYAVLYMHDGQMLFDANKSWNGQAWDVDDVATELLGTDKVRDFIVVGVWNSGEQRHPDYFPQAPFESLSSVEQDTVSQQLQRVGRTEEAFEPQSDQYLKFLVEELKPYIDEHYAVQSERDHTFIAGSSMGGLISMYAICEYPEVFGGAACLSTHWVGTFQLEHNPVPQAFIAYLNDHLPDPQHHKIYFDCGDQALDALYPPIQREVDRVIVHRGYTSENWTTRYFPGENHSEEAWKERLHIPLTFLLGRP